MPFDVSFFYGGEFGKRYRLIHQQSLCEELRLPWCIDAVDPDTVPATLLACAEEVQHDGGAQALRDMLNKVQQMSDKNVELVDEGFNALEEENEQDEILRHQFGSRKSPLNIKRETRRVVLSAHLLS